MKFIVVGYFTRGTFYEDMARAFVSSLKEHKILYYVEGVENLGSWYKNINYKPTFIKRMMEKFPEYNIVYVDCDAKFSAYPELFEEIEDNIAVHLFDKSLHKRKSCKGFEILSGTIFFKNVEEVYKLVEKWEQRCKHKPNQWDQKSLEEVLGEDFFILPPEYCKIFDVMSHIKNPVITHFQASRQVRRNKMKIKKCVMQESLPQVLSNRLSSKR